MKVMMTGGGTGGHIYPAIAIADTIKDNQPDALIIFVVIQYKNRVSDDNKRFAR